MVEKISLSARNSLVCVLGVYCIICSIELELTVEKM